MNVVNPVKVGLVVAREVTQSEGRRIRCRWLKVFPADTTAVPVGLLVSLLRVANPLVEETYLDGVVALDLGERIADRRAATYWHTSPGTSPRPLQIHLG